MKRIQNLLFLMVLLIVVFTFPQKVSAIGEPTFQSITVKQGNTILTKEGEIYTATGYDDLKLQYELANTSYWGSYYIMVKNGEEEVGMASGYYYPDFISEIEATFETENVEYTVSLCGDWNCMQVYDTRTIKITFTKFAAIADDQLWFTKVMQGGEEIEYIEDDGGWLRYELNNLQDVTFSVKGANLDGNANYSLSCADKKTYYTGNEIMAGVNHTCLISEYEYSGFDLYYSLYPSRMFSIGYKANETDVNTRYSSLILNTMDSVKDYNTTIKYANYSDISIPHIEESVWPPVDYYLALNKYFDSGNPITININGDSFENKNYDVKQTILNGSSEVYTKTESVAGNDLNDGYDAVFSGFNPGTVSNTIYSFRVTVDGVSKQKDVKYVYSNMPIVINGVRQGQGPDNGVSLEKVDGAYLATGYDYIFVDFDVTNYSEEDELYIRFANGTGSYRPNNPEMLDLNQFNQETEEFAIQLCGDMKCNTVYGFETIKIKLVHYNQIQNQRIWFYNPKQGDTSLTMDKYGNFNINDTQDVSIMVTGENLINDATYTLELGGYGSGIQVLGSKLANGVEVTATPNEYSDLSPYFRVGTISLDEEYYDGVNYHTGGWTCVPIPEEEGGGEDCYNVSFQFPAVSQYSMSYEDTLKYKNYPSQEVTLEDEEYFEGLYVINTQYHNSSNPLSYYVKGENYENKNYSGHVKVLKDYEDEIYTFDFTVSGEDLNRGTDIVLDGLTLPLPVDIDELSTAIYGMPQYTFYITIDSVTQHKDAFYNGVGKYVRIKPEIFFENGKKNLSVFRGFANSGLYDTNEDVFKKYSKIYINYRGFEFVEDEEYDYIIEYGYYSGEETAELTFPNRVDAGKITGKLLNDVGVFVELDNNKKYQYPSYRFYIKKGNEVLAYVAPIIYTIDKATLGSVMMTSQNRDMYLYTDDENYSYIATRDMPITINVSGIGFDDDRDYEFTLCYTPEYEEPPMDDNSVCDEIVLNGRELNDGIANLAFDGEIDKNAIAYSFYIYGGQAGDEDYFGQGMFNVKFVENKDLLPSINKYVIEDASDIIKNISKKTTASEFKNNITVTEGSTFKVFDKAGTTEVTGQIGTGMQGRIIDEYDRNIINIGIAVKGDITGDGNISLTDLVKVKKHLIETEILEDVYEAAGDVTGTGTITATDLVKMCQDVTGIEELS